MNITCQHCKRCFDHREAANAHTVYEFEKDEENGSFSSIDDNYGIDICQVCHKPPVVARLWHALDKKKILPDVAVKDNGRPQMAAVIL